MLTTIIFLSGMSVAGTLLALRRIMKWRNIVRFAVPIDVLFTIGMVIVGAGSVQGMAVAVTAAVLMSLVLWVGKLSVHGAKAAKEYKWKFVKVEV